MIGQRTRRMGFALEEFPELVPVRVEDFAPPWDLIPVAPFRTQAWHETDAVGPAWITTHSMDEALTAGCRTLGPGVGASMVVLDEGFHVIFGYVARTATLVELGAPVWYGCRVAYEWLERSGKVPLMDLAVWESTARDQATGG